MRSETIKSKRYSLSEAAKELKVTRQGLYYWIKKGWVKPKRDYRKYPVFTENEIKNIKNWRERLL